MIEYLYMVNIFQYVLVFFIGLAFGSFLNCVAFRLEKGEDFLTKRSYCPKCKHNLSWKDLVPFFSFLFLRGKCRYCKKKISLQYFLVETITAILFLLFFLNTAGTLNLIFNLVVVCFLILIFIYDAKHYLILDVVIYPAIIFVFLFNLLKDLVLTPSSLLNLSSFSLSGLLAGLIAGGFFFLIFFISKGKWMGGADSKLGFLLGLFLGWPKILPALFATFFIGSIVGVILILLKKKGLKSEVPFGPFLIIGSIISLFWGDYLINWYMNLIF